MFAIHGPAMLERLNGIFAFAIWDDRDKRLFLARDRLGVKPLYYTRRDGLFAFASELKALLPLIGRPTLDESALADYLTFLWVPDPKTAFKEIQKLPPGHYAWVDRDRLRVERYWDLRFAPESRPESEWRDEVADTVTRAVRRQMVSDVPLGSFLSGGVDSSAVVAAMTRAGGRVPTYTIGFNDADLRHEIVPDDLRYARRVGSLLETDYHEEILEAGRARAAAEGRVAPRRARGRPRGDLDLPDLPRRRERMPVMLSGMGGDEVFAGYPRYLAYRIPALPRPASRPATRAASSGRLGGPPREPGPAPRPAAQPVEVHARRGPAPGGAVPLVLELLHTLRGTRAAHARIRVGPRGYDPLAGHRGYLTRDTGADELGRLLYLDAKTFLPCLNLTYTDKMAMAASVEVRVPLLDDELVDLAAHIPSSLKLKRLTRKYIFKRSQEGVLPPEIIWRRKAGFGAPVRSWLVGDLAPLVGDLLSEGTLAERGLVRPDVVHRLWVENVEGRADRSLQLYALLSLELWCRTFVDRRWSFDSDAASLRVAA